MSDCESSYAVEETQRRSNVYSYYLCIHIAVVGEKMCHPEAIYNIIIVKISESIALSIVTLYNRQSV